MKTVIAAVVLTTLTYAGLAWAAGAAADSFKESYQVRLSRMP